jgi:aspartate-semialdehyde dehydrogenase
MALISSPFKVLSDRRRHGQCGPRNAQHPRGARLSRSTRWWRSPPPARGTEVSFGDKHAEGEGLDTYDFSDTDICLMSAGGNVSKEWSPKIGAQGCVVIDNSSAWRYDQDVPLIVPEVNPDAVAGFSKKNIIANPNCSTAQLVVALKPLHDAPKIKRVVVSTYQSVSGAGKEGMDELFTRPAPSSSPIRSRPRSSPSASPSTSSPTSTSSWKTATPRKSGR